MQSLKQFFRDEEGATALEYGLIAALIAAAIATAVGALGDTVSSTFNSIKQKMDAATSGTSS